MIKLMCLPNHDLMILVVLVLLSNSLWFMSFATIIEQLTLLNTRKLEVGSRRKRLNRSLR